MVGMGVGVDGVLDCRTEKTSQLDVIVGFVYFRIDDNTTWSCLQPRIYERQPLERICSKKISSLAMRRAFIAG